MEKNLINFKNFKVVFSTNNETIVGIEIKSIDNVIFGLLIGLFKRQITIVILKRGS